MSGTSTSRLAQEMGQTCLNLRARLVARVITGIYDDALRPLGIGASQLNLLGAVAAMGPVKRTNLGRYLHLDVSTLTRNLRVMETNGWIEAVPDPADGRSAPIRITSAGEALIAEAAPAWRSAQRRAAKLLGSDGKAALMAISAGVAA